MKLSNFQKKLLSNLINTKEILRFGHSKPVMQLIDGGYIEKKDDIFVATKKAKKLKL